MTITIKHVIVLEDETKQLVRDLIEALNFDQEVGKLADQVTVNNDKLQKAVDDNKGTIS